VTIYLVAHTPFESTLPVVAYVAGFALRVSIRNRDRCTLLCRHVSLRDDRLLVHVM